MENIAHKKWSKGKEIREPIPYYKEIKYGDHEIERALPISQDKLNNAKIFNSKYEYAKTLNKNIAYLEVGVGFGNSAQMFINTTKAKSADLLDLYNNASQTREPGGNGPQDISVTHEQHIKNMFAYNPNINIIKGDMKDMFFNLDKNYDLILFDCENERLLIRNALLHCSKIVNVGGIVGFTSYMNYDAIHYDMHVGIYQSVNEFLHFNNNWSVDALVLNDLGFHEIYIKKNSLEIIY
jgi:hypothetical protein